MTHMPLLPTPRAIQTGQKALRIDRNSAFKNLCASDIHFPDFPDAAEAAFRRANIKARFFIVEDFAPHAYKIEIAQGGIIVCGGDLHGLFYGYQTLRQIIRHAQTSIPACIIEDAPDMLFRAFHLDLSIHKYKTSYIKYIFHELARMKYAAVVLHYADTFLYAKEPLFTGNIFYDESKREEIRKAAENAGLELIPSLHCAGSTFGMTGFERYHANPPHITACIEHPRNTKIISSLIDELSDAHATRRMMLSMAPVHETRKGDAGKEDTSAYMQYFTSLFAHIDKKKIAPIITADILEKYPECARILPAGTLVVVADQPRDAAFSTALRSARDLGVGAIAAVYGRCAPDNELARDNLRAAHAARDAAAAVKRAGASGALLLSPPSTDGNPLHYDYGTPLHMMKGSRRMHIATTWYAVAAAADAFWNEKDAQEKTFDSVWPHFWFSVDDKRAVDIFRLQSRDVFQGATHTEIVRDRKRILSALADFSPQLHADECAILEAYARLSLHAVHVRQVFSHTPKKQAVSLLRAEISRVKELYSSALKPSLYSSEIREEQRHLFAHTEELLERMKRR